MAKYQKTLPKPHHREFAKNLVKHGGNATRAYLDTYPETTPKVAISSASRLLEEQPIIKSYAQRIAEKSGVTLPKICDKLNEKLDSKRPVMNKNGEVICFTEDNQSQLKAVELGLRIHKAISSDTDNSINTVNIQHNQSIIVEKLDTRLDRVLELFNKKPASPFVKDEIVSAGTNEPEYSANE